MAAGIKVKVCKEHNLRRLSTLTTRSTSLNEDACLEDEEEFLILSTDRPRPRLAAQVPVENTERLTEVETTKKISRRTTAAASATTDRTPKQEKAAVRKSRKGTPDEAAVPQPKAEQHAEDMKCNIQAFPKRPRKRKQTGADRLASHTDSFAVPTLVAARVFPDLDSFAETALTCETYLHRRHSSKWVGAHVSTAGGIERAPLNACAIGARAFALDLRSKRRWDCSPLTAQAAELFQDNCRKWGYDPATQVLPHGSYLINLCSPSAATRERSFQALVEELQRATQLGLRLYNIHPGSTCGAYEAEAGLQLIAQQINRALNLTQQVTVVLECTAGQGSTLGHSFQQLRYIIDHISDQGRIGVCLDTCHLFAAGYDISSDAGYDDVMAQFEHEVGLQYLRGLHLNDSGCALNSRRDRHLNLGRGHIGIACFRRAMNDPRFDHMPLIMETPSQQQPAALDYKASMGSDDLVWKQEDGAMVVSTDKRDIAMLYGLVR